MQGQQAVVIFEHELQQLVQETARSAAQEVINTFKEELTSDPSEVITKKLRAYIADRSTIANPREMWANSLHIRSLKLNSRHQPRSVSWFQKFKVQSGLNDCYSRKSQTTGGYREWCFEDVANALEKELA